MLVHLGEEVGVGALLEEPALRLELRDHSLVRLVKQAEAVQASDAGDRAAADGGQRDHELVQHLARVPANGIYSRRPGACDRMPPFLLLCLIRPALSALYTLQDLKRPGLSSDDQALSWWEGGPAFALASASAVRVNFRGLLVYPPKATVRLLNGSLGWHAVACNASAWALCSSDVGMAFPATGPRVPERQEAIGADGWADLGCRDSQGKTLSSLGFYDIGACDVFDEGVDLLYMPGTLFLRKGTLDTWEYWALVVLAIVLVRFLSYNLQFLWDPSIAGQHDQRLALACSSLAVIIVLLDGDSHFVTSADQLFFWSNLAYIVFYLIMHLARPWLKQNDGYDTPVYNILVASLQLIACRFYAAAETPYNLVLIAILATRGWSRPPSCILKQFFLGG